LDFIAFRRHDLAYGREKGLCLMVDMMTVSLIHGIE
jgi:hypothetical protein